MLPQNIFVSKFYSILHPQFLTPIYPQTLKKLSKHNFIAKLAVVKPPNLDSPYPKTYYLTQKPTFRHK